MHVIQTNQINIGIRFKKHLRNNKNQKGEKSPQAEHILGTNHILNSIQFLKQVKKSQELNFRVAIEMMKIKIFY